MSRRTPEVPSLADALAKGFADLNPDDENPSSVEEILEIPEVQESVDIEPPSKPQYGRPTQHKGQEGSFTVNANESTETSSNDEEITEQPNPPEVEILDKLSTSLGDDFDVEW